jgi:anaerobic magnesium-protoporphyrin IX monomethyl ester cyclase
MCLLPEPSAAGEPGKQLNMKKILFTHSYFLAFDPKQKRLGQPYPPLATLYAAGLLRQEKFEVGVYDTMFAEHADDILPALENADPEIFVIYDDGFNYLTKMCLTNMREAAFRMISHAKKRGCIVVVSSSDATDHFENYLEQGADYIVIGEAEHTLLELVTALNGSGNPSQVQGLAFRKGEMVIKTAKRSVMRELDHLPFPAWDMIDLKPYRDTWTKSAGYFSLNIVTTRGCPYKCNWCAKPIYGNRYNARSPQNVVDELLMLKKQYGFDHVWFCDDIFGLKPGWVSEFAELVHHHHLEFRFKIQSRADLLVQENYVADLKNAGCENVWMGAESGSQKILDAMDKGITTKQVEQATALLKKHGIRPSFFIQFGYLGETKEDIRLTIDMINRLLPAEIGISVSYPLPGTVFYEKVKQELHQKTNWTDSDELALMFRNTYQPEFYKQLHRYVHQSYRKHLAIEYIRQLLREPFKADRVKIRKALSLLYHFPKTIMEGMKLRKLEHS